MSTMPTPHEGPTTGEPAPEFQQKLGLFDSTMLVSGTMIGSGIFIVSAEIARTVGGAGWLMVVWIITGVMTILGALAYAELAAMMPHAGGQYVYLREAFSPLWGFLYGWTVFLVIQTGSIAAVGVAFAKYLGVFVPQLGTDAVLKEWKFQKPFTIEMFGLEVFRRDTFAISAGQIVGVIVVAALTLMNCRGVREGKWVQNVMAVAKTLALVLLIVLGLTYAYDAESVRVNVAGAWDHGDMYKETVERGFPSAAAICVVLFAAMVGSLFSADAWNNVTFTAGEVLNPRRNLPLSLLLGTGLVIVLYLLANLAYMAALPVKGDAALAKKLADEYKAAGELDGEARIDKLREIDREYNQSTLELGIDHARDERVGTAALQRVSPRYGVWFMAAAIMISTFGCVNGMILMGARLYYAMARDGLFFSSVGRLNQRGVPAMGLILQGLWSIVLVFSGTYNELLDYVMFAAVLFYVLTVAGLFVLRFKKPDAERPYRALGYPVLPAIYVLLCLFFTVNLLYVKPQFTLPGLILVATGIPVYFSWRLTSGRKAT